MLADLVLYHLNSNFADKPIRKLDASLDTFRIPARRQIGAEAEHKLVGDILNRDHRQQVLLVREPDRAVLGAGADVEVLGVEYDLQG